jgi:hypothetical protein
MIVNVVVKSVVDVINLRFNTQQNLLVFCVLLSVPFVESGETPHKWSANDSDNNRNPPHLKSHPTIPNRFSLDARISGLAFLLPLAFTNGGTMKICLAMAKTKADALDMALKAHSPTSGHDIKREDIPAFRTVN